MDQNTIERLINGEVGAFECVFREYARSMHLVALGLYRDAQVAEDAVQESFVYLWNHRQQINPALSVEGYLRTSVRNYVFNYIRHQNILQKREEEIIREQEAMGRDEEEEDLSVKIRVIREVVDSLPEACRKIFVMSVIEGMSYTDTAEKLGVSVNTVKSQVKIAYKKIKNTIQENPDKSVDFFVIFVLSMNKSLGLFE